MGNSKRKEEAMQALLNAAAEQGQTRQQDMARLLELCREFMGYLDVVEVSGNEREFHPTYVASCRTMVMDRLGKIIPEIKQIVRDQSPVIMPRTKFVEQCVSMYNAGNPKSPTSDDADVWDDLYPLGITPKQAVGAVMLIQPN